MWSFEARLQETPGHHFRDSRCASRSRERTMACCFTSRLRISPIPYPLRYQDAQALGLYAASPFGLKVRISLCRCSDLPAASAAGRKTDAHLGYGAFRNDAPIGGVAR